MTSLKDRKNLLVHTASYQDWRQADDTLSVINQGDTAVYDVSNEKQTNQETTGAIQSSQQMNHSITQTEDRLDGERDIHLERDKRISHQEINKTLHNRTD